MTGLLSNKKLLGNKKSFFYLFFGVFLIGNTFLSLLQRSVLKKILDENFYQYISIGNLLFLISSFTLVVFVAWKLEMRIFLYSCSMIFLTLCLITFSFFGFYSPFSLVAYSLNSILNDSNFPTLLITR